mmetsp:Transcript_35394/g.83298  ORF Transcript_35394/g.83298 Transcript_35394/m.83298 type:complete len:202 (-) Transcript_35394:311-916(-)
MQHQAPHFRPRCPCLRHPIHMPRKGREQQPLDQRPYYGAVPARALLPPRLRAHCHRRHPVLRIRAAGRENAASRADCGVGHCDAPRGGWLRPHPRRRPALCADPGSVPAVPRGQPFDVRGLRRILCRQGGAPASAGRGGCGGVPGRGRHGARQVLPRAAGGARRGEGVAGHHHPTEDCHQHHRQPGWRRAGEGLRHCRRHH